MTTNWWNLTVTDNDRSFKHVVKRLEYEVQSDAGKSENSVYRCLKVITKEWFQSIVAGARCIHSAISFAHQKENASRSKRTRIVADDPFYSFDDLTSDTDHPGPYLHCSDFLAAVEWKNATQETLPRFFDWNKKVRWLFQFRSL